MVYYFDSSALVKLYVPEPGRQALVLWLVDSKITRACSTLVHTEVERALRKNAQDESLQQSLNELTLTLKGFVLLPVSQAILRTSGWLEPVSLRSLDAIHLATALTLRPELDGLVTYDNRLTEAARFHGINVIQPS